MLSNLKTRYKKLKEKVETSQKKGKSGKWGEVVEDKDLGISYREKVIELPKHRQEETEIKAIVAE